MNPSCLMPTFVKKTNYTYSNKMEVKIRYNTQATGNDPKWRLLIDGAEILVNDILICCRSKTTEDEIPGVGKKCHITCQPQKIEIDEFLSCILT